MAVQGVWALLRHAIMFSPEMFIIIALTFVAAGFVKGTIGLGLPTVTLALLTLPLGLQPTLTLLVVPLVVANLVQATQGGHFVVLLKRLWLFWLMAGLAVALGVQVLAAARSDVLVAILGVILILNSVNSFTRFRIKAPRPETERAWSAVCGGLGGVMFGMTGNFIVPGILFLQALALPRNMMVQALGMTFCSISAVLAVTMTSKNMLDWYTAGLSTLCLVPAFAGMWLGTRYRHRISEGQFSNLFFAGLLVIGCSLLFGAVRNLWTG